MTALEQFILEHENDDIPSLLLSKSKFAGVDVEQACLAIQCRRRMKEKVPVYYAVAGLRYVSTLSAEQCSSQKTAQFKAQVAAEILDGSGGQAGLGADPGLAGKRPQAWNIADLTGGMGVDAMVFSQVAAEVLYNEMNPVLAEATAHNFALLGINNVRFSQWEVKTAEKSGISDAGGSDESEDTSKASAESIWAALDAFRPDLIFLDPARRSDSGAKVFRLEDCSPNLLELKDDLLARCPRLLVKLSPMADISAIAQALGSNVKQVYLVASDGECKEMLVHLDREHNGAYDIVVHEEGGTFAFTPEEERQAVARKADSLDEWQDCPALFDPGKALLKAGCFKLLSQRFGLTKLATSTHLYGGPIESLPAGLGRCWLIDRVLPFSSHTLKALGCEYPPMDVTARNIPLTSQQLAQRIWGTKVAKKQPTSTPTPIPTPTPQTSGLPARSPAQASATPHLFALTCEDTRGRSTRLLFLCHPIPKV